jgi:hypothetical protein
MSEIADDTQEFAEKIAHSDACEERFEQLFELGMNGGPNPYDYSENIDKLEPPEHLDFIIENLTDEFVREDENIQNDAPGYGELLVKSFQREVAEMFKEEAESRQEFLEHLKDIAEDLSDIESS